MSLDAEWGPVPFEEAEAFFNGKIPMSADDFLDLSNEARVRAFTVSGMAGLDALAQIRDSLAKALQEGQSFAEWKRGVADLLAAWAIDGFHARMIFDTNLNTAYEAGHYQRMMDPDVLEEKPYWRYVPSTAAEPRVEHMAWYDLVLPADDPFWDTHYPPNGWGCQ
jgi:uncharacterized protein with gpF-like domain